MVVVGMADKDVIRSGKVLPNQRGIGNQAAEKRLPTAWATDVWIENNRVVWSADLEARGAEVANPDGSVRAGLLAVVESGI